MKTDPTPFVKWVGGKRSILPELLSRLPSNMHSYYECFVGGGALFFASRPNSAVISDINSRLINTYVVVRDRVDDLIKELTLHSKRNDATYYTKVRLRFNADAELTSDSALLRQAAAFIYLNKTCFNGLFRENSKGEFNVPFGKYAKPSILDECNLRLCSAALQGVRILHQSFVDIDIVSNGFYYLDPPYDQTFTSYDSQGFSTELQVRLAATCYSIDAAGGKFMLSNSDTEFIRRLYSRFNIETVAASRLVACKSASRGKVTELIVRNYK